MAGAFTDNGCSDRYKILDIISSGSMGDIVRVEKDQCQFAAKIVPLFADKSYCSSVDNEVKALSCLHHGNIVLLLDLFVQDNNQELWLVFDWAKYGDLEHYLTSFPFLQNNQLISFVCQLCEALDYIHKQGYCHRDITPRNVLVFDKNTIRLSDFGQCVKVDGSVISVEETRIFGDIRYMAPEVLSRKSHHTIPSDLWSLGCCIYFLLTARHLLEGNENDIRHLQRKGQILYHRESLYNGKYSKLKQFISKLVSYDPETRIPSDKWQLDSVFRPLQENTPLT